MYCMQYNHTQLAKLSFDENFDLTAGVYSNFVWHNIPVLRAIGVPYAACQDEF